MNVQEVRQQFPQYQNLSDKEFVDAIHSEYYSDIPIEEYYQKINFNPEEQPEPEQEQERLPFFTRMGRSFRSGYQSTVVGMGTTGEVMLARRADRARERGDEEEAEELMERARALRERMVEREDIIQNLGRYQSKYGETGVESFKNLTDSQWWSQTLGELIPGSAPFLTGAIGAYKAAKATPMGKNMPTAIGAAMAGGGGAVFAQEFGDAYVTYLEENPGDKQGAEEYAKKKAGFSSVVNALSVVFGRLGVSKRMIEFYLQQAIIQPAIGTADTLVGNVLVKQNIDPDQDLTEGLVKSATGEFVFEGPALARAVRRQYMGEKTDLQTIQDEFFKSIDEGLETQATEETQAAFGDMSLEELKEYSSGMAEFKGLEIYPNDTQETVLRKMKDIRKAKIQEEMAEETARESVLSVMQRPTVLKTKTEDFEQIPREDLFNQIIENFGTRDENGEINVEDAWRAYTFWARERGYAPSVDILEAENFLSEDVDISKDIQGLAEAATDNAMRRREGPSSAFSEEEFKNYVDYIQTQIPKEQLKILYQRFVPGATPDRVAIMSNEDLAFGLAEFASILEVQQSKNSTAFVESKKPFKKLLSKAFPNLIDEEGTARTFTIEVDERPDDPNIRRELEPTGNALFAEGQITKEDGTVETVYFERDGFEGMEFLDTLRSVEGMYPSIQDAARVPSNLGRMVDTVDGVSLEQIEAENPNFNLTAITFPENLLPQNQSDFYNKRIVGPWFRYARPAGQTGLPVFEAIKRSQGRIRSLQYEAERLGYKVNQAVLGATRNKENNLTDLEARLLLGSFIKKTNTYIALTPEQKQGKKDEIADIDKKLENENGYLTREDIEELETRKAGLQVDLEGPVSVKLAVKDLPKELQGIALESRKKIDALSKRILNEGIGKKLGEEERNIIENAIGEYTTSVLAYYETALGHNPKYDKSAFGTLANFVAGDITFKKRRIAQQLYDRAVTSVMVTQKDSPNFARNPRATAEKVIDNALRKGAEEARTEVFNVKETSKQTSQANTVQMQQGLKLRERKYMPYPLRKLLGEITEKEPDILVATSFAKVAQLVERNKLLEELLQINYNIPGEMFLSPVRNEAAGYVHQIAQDDLNPIGGMWTTKTYADALDVGGGAIIDPNSLIYKVYRNLILLPKGATQYGMVVISPGTQIRNFEGGGMMFLFTGNLFSLSPRGNYSEAARMAQSVLFPDLDFAPDGSLTGDGAKAEKISRIGREQGVMFTNSVTRDALAIFKEVGSSGFSSQDQVIHALYSMKHTPLGKFYDGTIGNVLKGLGRLYNLVDDFFKMLDYAANIYNIEKVLSNLDKQAVAPIPNSAKLKMLKDFSSTLTVKAGTYKSDAGVLYKHIDNLEDYTYTLAAWMTRNTMANYDFVGRFAQMIRQLPLGSFIAFPTEMLRTTGNNAQLGYKLSTYKIPEEIAQDMGIPVEEVVLNKNEDGTTSEKFAVKRPFKGLALQRYVGAALATYVIPKGLQVWAQLYFGVNDEELEALDSGAPPYERYAQKIPMSEIDPETGEINYMVTTYTFPYQEGVTSVETIKKVMDEELEVGAELPSAITKGLMAGFQNYMKAYYGIGIAPRVQLELALNMDLDTGNPIYNEMDDWGEKLKAMSEHVLKEAGPGGYRQLLRVSKAFATGDARFDRYGNVEEYGPAFAGLGGVSIRTQKPLEKIGFNINTLKNGFEDYVKQNMKEFRNEQDAKNAQEVLDQWDDAQSQWFELQQDFYKQYVDLRTLAGDALVKEAKKQLKERAPAGIDPQKFAKNMLKGVFTPWEMPDSYEDNYLKIKKEKKLDREWPKEQLRARYRYLKNEKISLMSSPTLPTPWTED